MPDREKVIKALEYFLQNRICLPHLIPWAEISDALALLQEQEPIWNDVLNVWTCPSCGQMVSTNYCRDCGKKVKWE